MRILFLTNLYPPVVLGGYEISCAQAAEALQKRGHDVRVLTTWSHLPEKTQTAGWVHRRLDLHWYIPHTSNSTYEARDLHNAVCSSYANTLQLLDAVTDFRPDIVSVWNIIGIGGLAMLDLLNYLDVPWAIWLGDRIPVDIATNVPEDVRGLFNGQGSNIYEKALVQSVSQNLLNEIETLSGITFSQGVDIVAGWADLSSSVPHGTYLREGKARFVAASSIGPNKGTDLILEASARLHDAGVDFSVDLFGEGDIPHYIDKVKRLHLQDRVRFRGQLPYADLLRSYADYDAFLCPTWERDPFPFAPLCASGCGAPPIITRNCGTSERLVDGVHCIKIERTVDDLAKAMSDVAAGHIDLAKMGRAGRRLVMSDLSFDRHLDKLESAFKDHMRPWNLQNDPKLPLLLFLKHNLSVRLRFG
ncbi:glycosyltransferase family 4 protein [Methylobacterium sp. 88A]|uniref:glycosyltransferase family 4 protein n=1 Tax=Methylobacterium sp. 88A TaxID=1131813 RepID=UPI0018DED081|nr:glycosyltransferase family 4 protein [Methylobacterium sp. 88A]